MRSVRLSSAQVTYLLGAEYLPSELRDSVAAAIGATPASKGVTWEIDGEVAECFRSAFTDRLAEVGFDPDYELTNEGVVLEELIDAFFRGAE